MGQAKLRGSFEQRKAAAVDLARVRDEAAFPGRMDQMVARQEQELREARVHRAIEKAANPGASSPISRGRVINKHGVMLAALALGGMMAIDYPERNK